MSPAGLAVVTSAAAISKVQQRTWWVLTLIEQARTLADCGSDLPALNKAAHMLDCADFIGRGIADSLDAMFEAAHAAEQKGGAA